MGRIVVFTSLTHDGVMQAPGRADEVVAGYVAGSVDGLGFDGSVALGGDARIETLRFELLGRAAARLT